MTKQAPTKKLKKAAAQRKKKVKPIYERHNCSVAFQKEEMEQALQAMVLE